MKKRTKYIIIIIIVAVIVVVAAGAAIFSHTGKKYVEEPAKKIDLVSKLEFAGDVEANESKAIYSVVNQVKVIDVPVKEGDYVKKGDVLVELDKTEIKYNIMEKELQLEQAQYDRDNNLENDQTELTDLKGEVSKGLNPEILAKETAVHTAQSEYDTFVYKWNKAVMDFNNGMNQELINAQNAVLTAQTDYCQVEKNGQASLAATEEMVETKRKKYKRLDDEYDDNGSDVSKDDVKDAKREYEEAKAELEKARTSVETDRQSKAVAVQNAQNVLAVVSYGIHEQNYEYNVLEFVKHAQALADAKADLEAAKLTLKQQEDSLSKKIDAQRNNTSVSQAQVALDHLRSNYNNYTITAPCNGYVSGLDVKPGDTVDTKVLMHVLNYDKMKVNIDVDEYDIGRFTLGTPVRIKINSLSKEYEGTVTGIAAKAEKKNDLSFIKITASFEPDERMSSGIGATVYTLEDESAARLCIPAAAISVSEETGESIVTVVEGKKTRTQVVEAGEEQNGYVVILSGLKEGEIVRYTEEPESSEEDENE